MDAVRPLEIEANKITIFPATPTNNENKKEAVKNSTRDDLKSFKDSVDIDRERTLTGHWALFVLFVAFTFVTVAFVSPSWLAGDERIYQTKLEKLGLWVHCFRSLPDYNDYTHVRYFAGCRWIFNPFTEGYAEIRNYLAPRK